MTRKTTFAETVARKHSLRTRILLFISTAILLIVLVLIGLSEQRIQHMSQAQITHEGILLSHTLEAAIIEDAARGDAAPIQRYIDQLVRTRGLNDFEVNVLFLTETGSTVVASNVPDNIEEADEEEHEATMIALRQDRPVLEIETEDGPENEEEERLAADPGHPDYYFPENTRVLGVTTPLAHAGRPLGSINVELCLKYLDEERAQLIRQTLVALFIGCLIVAMVHGTVQNLGGGMALHSTRNEGTCFDVFVPLVANSSSEAPNEAARLTPPGHARVLIVDDEPSIASMLGKMLSTLGYRCDVCHDPAEALIQLEILQRSDHPVERVLSDVAMPGMTGVEFARALTRRHRGIPIILCSGYTGGINWRTAGEVGIRAVIGKPISRRKLAETVYDVLRGCCLEKSEVTACM